MTKLQLILVLGLLLICLSDILRCAWQLRRQSERVAMFTQSAGDVALLRARRPSGAFRPADALKAKTRASS